MAEYPFCGETTEAQARVTDVYELTANVTF